MLNNMDKITKNKNTIVQKTIKDSEFYCMDFTGLGVDKLQETHTILQVAIINNHQGLWEIVKKKEDKDLWGDLESILNELAKRNMAKIHTIGDTINITKIG